MDDATILAQRQLLEAKHATLLEESYRVRSQIRDLPLTTEELKKQEENLKGDRQAQSFLFGITLFFILLTMVGILGAFGGYIESMDYRTFCVFLASVGIVGVIVSCIWRAAITEASTSRKVFIVSSKS
jgi:hypothetical protein